MNNLNTPLYDPLFHAKNLNESERDMVVQRRRDSLMPLRFHNASLETLEHYQASTLEALNEMMNGRSSGIVLVGDPGRGKTYIACAILNFFLATGRGIFLSMENLNKAALAQESNLIERARGTGLLVLDDVGHGKQSPWFVQLLHKILDVRWSNNKPTIITTNFKNLYGRLSSEGEEQTAAACVSRIRDFSVLRLDGKDLRGQVAHESL